MGGRNRSTVYLKGLAVWAALIFAEILHGAVRVLLMEPYVGDFRARQIGVFTGSLIILCIAYLTVEWIHAEGSRQLLAVGILWMLMTVLFEVSIGRAVFGYSWERIASDYNVLEGGLLPIGLLILLLAPKIAARFRRA
jgi:hypothetical protein